MAQKRQSVIQIKNLGKNPRRGSIVGYRDLYMNSQKNEINAIRQTCSLLAIFRRWK